MGVADAEECRLVVWSAVKRGVVAVIALDPGSGSGKARKAHEYGIPVVRAEVLPEASSSEPATVTQRGDDRRYGPRSEGGGACLNYVFRFRASSSALCLAFTRSVAVL
jgi:hypothetical protein